ncbi:MAG: HK97 family phage prohead protease [Holosporales bacterium]|jgi:HK97 family phage prohead protease|nr:HK97 family phage prohead protease [Holosporales bacterium]
MRNSFVRRIPAPLDLKALSRTGEFQGYASVFDVVDADGDILTHGAFEKCLKDQAKTGKTPKLLWQHDATQPIGIWHEIREDSYGLFVRGKILLDLEKGREAYTLLKNGALEGLSIGFYPIKSRPTSEHNARRFLEEVTLLEISLVTFAANPLANVTDCKGRGDTQAENLLAEIALRRLTLFLQKSF